MLKELVFIVTVVVRIKCRTRGLGSSWNERGQGEKAAVGIKKDRVFRREEINERY